MYYLLWRRQPSLNTGWAGVWKHANYLLTIPSGGFFPVCWEFFLSGAQGLPALILSSHFTLVCLSPPPFYFTPGHVMVYAQTMTDICAYTLICLHLHMSSFSYVFIFICLHLHMSSSSYVYTFICLLIVAFEKRGSFNLSRKEHMLNTDFLWHLSYFQYKLDMLI